MKKILLIVFLAIFQPLRLTLKVVMAVVVMEVVVMEVVVMEVVVMEVEAITEVAGIMEIMGETLGGGG